MVLLESFEIFGTVPGQFFSLIVRHDRRLLRFEDRSVVVREPLMRNHFTLGFTKVHGEMMVQGGLLKFPKLSQLRKNLLFDSTIRGTPITVRGPFCSS